MNGGRWLVFVPKELVEETWERMVRGGALAARRRGGRTDRAARRPQLLAIVGEQFDVGQEICGAVCAAKGNEFVISVWNRTASNFEATNRIKCVPGVEAGRTRGGVPDSLPLSIPPLWRAGTRCGASFESTPAFRWSTSVTPLRGVTRPTTEAGTTSTTSGARAGAGAAVTLGRGSVARLAAGPRRARARSRRAGSGARESRPSPSSRGHAGYRSHRCVAS